LSLAGLLIVAAPAFAHDEHGEFHEDLNAEHGEGHEELNAEHDAGHDQLEAEHEAWHREHPYASTKEHRRLHKH
jgi:hypothetical protein